MIFFGDLLELLEELFGGVINHFPLIELLIFSLDKTLIYYIGFLIIYSLWIYHRGGCHWKKILCDHLFFIYIVLLIHLTVFRYNWQWWEASPDFSRPLSDWELIPMADTVKLVYGDSSFSFWYNFFGNVLWFVPLGFFIPQYTRNRYFFFHTILIGLLVSVGIETGQFLLRTGISHIDDIIFNVMGVALGYFIYDIVKIRKEVKRS